MIIQVLVSVVLLGALFGSGVFRYLWKFLPPKPGQNSPSTRTRASVSGPTMAQKRQPQPRKASPTEHLDSAPSQGRRGQVGMGSELIRLAARLTVLEAALQTGEASLGGARPLRSPAELRRNVRSLWRQGADVATMARQLHLSQGEVELIVGMIAVEG